MGHVYCLAGAIVQGGEIRIVRPLPVRDRYSPMPNSGWSPFLLDRHQRWELFELVGPIPANAAAPHLEDVWVDDLRPRGQLATPEQRRAILQATLTPTDQPLFGEWLSSSANTAFLEPGQGERSLASVVVPSREVHFNASWREGAGAPDCRVTLPVPGLGRRILPLKDHFLLRRADRQPPTNVAAIPLALDQAVRKMGEEVVVRLGLSRPFEADGQHGRCWLMADGFFSLSDPQP